MLNEKIFHRQLDILAPEEANKKITIIGTGAIGSITALCLAKIGCSNLVLIDPDIVKYHNIPSQLFTPEQANEKVPKVKAIADTIKKFMDLEPEIIAEKWEDQISPIMILAVDSMAARKEIYDKLKENYSIELMIESRMAAEKMRIYTGMPSDEDFQRFYDKMFYTDEEANQEKCTEKAIAYNTFVIGGIITSIIKKHFKNEEMPKELIFNLEDYSLYKG